MKKQVILTAHDIGYSKSVNAGLKYALENLPPVFSELSLLPNSRYSEEAAAIAKESGISTNLAISLVNHNYFSLSGGKTLTDEHGHLKSVNNVAGWDFSVIDSFDQTEIDAEIEAQYNWFLQHMGRKPSALVTQKGEHGDPKILEPLIRLAKKEHLPMRAPLWQWKANYGAQSLVESEGIKTTSHFLVCFKDWQSGSGYDLEKDLNRLVSTINSTDGICELALFIGFCDQELIDITSISWHRGQLLNILKRKYFVIEKLYREFEIISYQDLS